MAVGDFNLSLLEARQGKMKILNLSPGDQILPEDSAPTIIGTNSDDQYSNGAGKNIMSPAIREALELLHALEESLHLTPQEWH